MDGSLIIAALIAAPFCYLFLRWYLPRLPKRKTWREQFEEGRSASKAETDRIVEQARQYQELRDRAKQEKDGSV
ncbi:hypothetical protein [Polymorphum gilvum]|uniref:Uncharacterized protein n=1 Tax=Polymorphum gilvum (strain LMG 25793 / CGMCC 1.9160 / SL003B-26A1) TaxID=991905 RepID=F2J3T9_POLGS|nr:hypothetical protein [Polymorphum gilvum]ADZ68921.1 hypothetical protein SL003B_0486 [Polymorphum gilvum SL003B-26A1]